MKNTNYEIPFVQRILCWLSWWRWQAWKDRGTASRKLCEPEIDRSKRTNDELSEIKACMRELQMSYESAIRSVFEEQFRADNPNDPTDRVPGPYGFCDKHWNTRTVGPNGGSIYQYPKVRAAWHSFARRHNVWSLLE